MNRQTQKVELLAPAGDFEKLEIAIHYGADAVYLGGKNFSLRNFSGNFTEQELRKAISVAHQSNVKVYVACNIYPRSCELPAISDHLVFLGKIEPDAIIIADPGIVNLAKEKISHIPVHLSTQANTTHIQSVLFWQNLGVKRINIARELSLEEIREIASHSDVEIEAFVHGAMCIAYSGRCLLSGYMANRDSNRGMCAHPCRWRYAVVEELRPGQYLPLTEDDRGSYIFSSKDLCMIGHIPDMIRAGICALKIEGRMKGIHYLAAVVKAYREAIDAYYNHSEAYVVTEEWTKELSSINHRGYCTGFYFGNPDQVLPNYSSSMLLTEYLFVGKILRSAGEKHFFVDVRNKINKNDSVEILRKNGPAQQDTVLDITGLDGAPLSVVQPGNRVLLKLENDYAVNDIIRKKIIKDHLPISCS